MKKFFEIATVIALSVVLIQGICYAGKPQCCFIKSYKNKQIFDEKKFVREYISKDLEFLSSPFFINQVVYIPFTELSKIVDSPCVRAYFYSINYRHINAFKDNPLALVKFIVNNEGIYKPVVISYLHQKPHLVQKKIRDSRLIRLGNELRNLSIGNEVFNLIQLPVEFSEEKNNQVPFSSTSELNETNKKTPIPSIFTLLAELNDTSEKLIPQIPRLSKGN